MSALLDRLWPKSLAGRLTLYLVLALAVAQAGLTLLLSSQRDVFVATLTHNQSLNQTVTLARLLDQYPASEADRLTAAFGSRQSCAWVRTAPPPAHTMTSSETQLAKVLASMLHGVRAGEPLVVVEAAPAARQHCDETGAPVLPPADSSALPETDGDHRDGAMSSERFAALAIDVPLADGRWLSVRTRVDVPGDFDRMTLITFLLSSIAVAVATALVVRHETKSLRALADASERLGKGEAVAPLPTNGPDEVSAATRAFNTMQERLREFIGERIRLLAGISHDLRTPITTLRLKAEFIDDETVREDLIKTIDELATICEATLAFTRAEAASEDTKVLDLGELVREVEQELLLAGLPVREGQIEPVRCACRPVALKRAVRNLVENAVRYGKRAEISVFRAADRALIRIDDEGPGSPVDRLAEAFEPFVRLEPSRNPETGGIGLGLGIARGIVSAHGGTLTLSNLEPGLRAEISLPTKL